MGGTCFSIKPGGNKIFGRTFYKEYMAFFNKTYFQVWIILMVLCRMNGTESAAQCTKVPVRESVVNGNFDEGYLGFVSPGYTKLNPGDTSHSGTYMVHTNVHPDTINFAGKSSFNPNSFDGVYDHTRPGIKGNFLMVDALSEVRSIAWQEEMVVIPYQKYYFSAWIANLVADNKALLQFEIKGELDQNFVPLVANFTVNGAGVWSFVSDTTWNSGGNTRATLRIIDSQTDPAPGNDFAIDDISFINGCNNVSASPLPDLGETIALCNTGGSIQLDSRVKEGQNTQFTWLSLPDGAPAGGNTSIITISNPGTYKVCVSQNGECAKSSTVNVMQAINVNLGPDITLCDPPTATIHTYLTDASLQFTWFKDGIQMEKETSSSLYLEGPGTYVSEVLSASGNCLPAGDTDQNCCAGTRDFLYGKCDLSGKREWTLCMVRCCIRRHKKGIWEYNHCSIDGVS
jgi:hypothetical protein